MPSQIRQYEKGTFLVMWLPFGSYFQGAAMCPDGKVRRLKTISECADTAWTIPASISYRGKTVSGHVEFKSDSGLSTDEKQFVAFVPHGKHKDIFNG
jgi:hypothetical protein